MEWPPLQGQEVSVLKQTFLSPEHLEAAFDSEDEAGELSSLVFSGISAGGLADRKRALMHWKDRVQGAAKRMRRDAFTSMVEKLPGSQEVQSLTEVFASETRKNPLVLLPGLDRRRKALKLDKDATQRAEQEKLAREKYALLLCQVIQSAKLPLVEILSGIEDPEGAWKRVFGTRRSKTLRNRYRSWRSFEQWITVIYGRTWPTNIAQLIGYVDQRCEDGCGKTVLVSFQASLAVLETAGRVPEGEMLSRDKTWLAHLAARTAELVAASPPTKQAPMYTVATVVALECYVVSEAPEYARALAWVALLMVYCSLRADDVQGIIPDSMELSAQGFKARLGRTKTTGPDRRCKEVQIFVHRMAGISGNDWLRTGLDIWRKYSQKRDFLVLEAERDWKRPTADGVDAPAVALYVSSILQQLGTPKLEGNAYRLNNQRSLMSEGVHRFYTGHSPRNFLTSVAAAVGVSKDDRDFLGRWMIARAKGSAEYTRTSRAVVQSIQETVCRTLLSGDGGNYIEDECLDELKRFLDDQGASGSLARRRHDIMKRSEGRRHLGLKWPPIELEDDEPSGDETDEVPEGPVEGSAKYFIAVSKKSGHRRLHLNGPCHVKPYHCSSVSFVNEVSLEDIDSICRDCKHRLRKEQDQELVGESTSDSSSSST